MRGIIQQYTLSTNCIRQTYYWTGSLHDTWEEGEWDDGDTNHEDDDKEEKKEEEQVIIKIKKL